MTNIKPCPHCGSTDLTGPHCQDYVGDTYFPSWWIECKHCPCGMTVNGETPDALIEAWNRRV